MNTPIPLSNNKLKFFTQLTTKKGRDKENLFMIDGKKLIQEAINENIPFHSIIITEKFQNFDFHLPKNINYYIAKENEFKKLTYLENPEGVIGVLPKLQNIFPQNIENQKFFILDRIQDPGNLGTILRICDAFGIHGVIVHQCVEVYNPKVIRASMGAIFRVPCFEVSIQDLIKKFSSKIAKTDIKGNSITKINLSDYQFIVLGNEANGILSDWNSLIPQTLSIPQSGNAESLNVAIACGILAWEWSK